MNAGIDVDQPAATFCQGGGRAAVMAFGLAVLGSPEARNYYSSWGEWGDDETAPIERPSTYAREELVIEAAELKKLPSRPGSRRVLDARAKKQFEEGHLKDSIHVVAADWSNKFGDGRDTDLWGRRLSQLGIGRDTEVIVYDNNAGQDAARIWWYLKYWGVCQARLVNGGWKAIQAAELPTETGVSRLPAEASFSSPPLALRKIDQASLVAIHQSGRLGTEGPESVQLVDARSEKEFLGLQVAEGQRPGTIPGARHLEWSDLVEPVTGRFRPTPDVLQLLKDRGIDLNRPIVTFSNTRSRSSSIAFPLELAGAIQTRVFETGVKSWGSDPNNPIVVPKQ